MRGQETNKLEGLKLKAGLGESFGVIHSNCETHNTGEKDFVNKSFSSLPTLNPHRRISEILSTFRIERQQARQYTHE